MKTMCKECKIKPVFIKKRQLCKNCYYRFQRTHAAFSDMPPTSPYLLTKIKWQNELDFVKNYFTHKNWIYQPASFRLNGTIYQPDFYDGERNVFIEVSGTSSAFYANHDKYREFIKTFPRIKFEVRQVNGTKIPLSATKGSFHKLK